MTTTFSRAAVALAAAGTLVLAGCSAGTSQSEPSSSSSTTSSATSTKKSVPSSAQLLKDMKAAAFEAQSVRMRGEMTLDGKPSAFEIAGAKGSNNWVANITSSPSGGTADIINVDGALYVKGDREFWNAQGAVAADDYLQGKYLRVPASEAGAGMEQYSIDNMLKMLYEDEVSASDGWGTKVEETTLDDKPVYMLSDRGDEETKIYLSAEDEHQLYKAVGKMDDGSGFTVTFTEWDAVAPVTAPPPDQVREVPN